MYALFAPIVVKLEHMEAFIEASIANGKAALIEEPGCVRFDVLRDRSNSKCVHFYEIYRDEAAFNAHEGTAHYAEWERATQHMTDESLPYTIMELVFTTDHLPGAC